MDINLKTRYDVDARNLRALFWCSLCSGSIGYGSITLDCSKEAYKKAKESLSNESDNTICYEDIWTRVFMNDDLLILEYDDYDDTNVSRPVRLDDCYDNISKMQEEEPWILRDFAEGNDDANTHDSFLQFLLLGELKYC